VTTVDHNAPAPNTPTDFKWEPQPEGQKLVDELLTAFLDACPTAAHLAEDMKHKAGTRFKDWVDHIAVDATDDVRARLEATGFTRRPLPGAEDRYVHDGAIFPAIILRDDPATRVGIKVDSVATFAATHQLSGESILGEPGSRVRFVRACKCTDTAELWVVERHGCRNMTPTNDDDATIITAQHWLETIRTRPRAGLNEPELLDATIHMLEQAVDAIGVDWTCDLFFWGEREYWQRFNRAARVQYERQNALGLGWANHDHHTYRCSRDHYPRVIKVLETLGFHCRERFHAGAEAGWGAQVLEQPTAGITIFADVDMAPEEVLFDFAHEGFNDKRAELGTVGLWVGLHGESILAAGMHHLECQFDWHALKDQLQAEAGIGTMDPFTTFPFLRQAFTEGERWPVHHDRIQRLLDEQLITDEQANDFRTKGAIGSHLENLERNDGFKGFNQQGVSDIISRTDPRKLVNA
jgi:hypothetical protein